MAAQLIELEACLWLFRPEAQLPLDSHARAETGSLDMSLTLFGFAPCFKLLMSFAGSLFMAA